MTSKRKEIRNRKLIRKLCAAFCCVLAAVTAVSAAPADELMSVLAVSDLNAGAATVQELTLQGRYFEAMVKFKDTGEQGNVSEQLAAAKSAWALGLVDEARKIWDSVLANQEFQGTERARAVLARAILEYQEGNYEQARAAAESVAQKLDISDLRAQFWMLIGEALKAQGALSLAEGYYQKAVDEGSFKASTEAVFQLGECQRRLGLINESRYTFAGIDTSSPYTAQALRKLAEIDLAQRNFEGVLTWLEEGRETYPGEFSDGWSSYALVSALIALNRLDNAEAELTSFRVKHSDTDSWFVLAQAGLEAAYAREINTKTPPAAINSIQEEKVLP